MSSIKRETVDMRNLCAKTILTVCAALAFSSVARAQGANAGVAQYRKLPTLDTPGGPAPVHDVTGVWVGPMKASADPYPPMTPLGQKRFSMNRPEATYGTAGSTDPQNTCDPSGLPRILLYSAPSRNRSFASLPNKIVVMQQYQKIWRDVWMDGRELPKNVGAKGGPPARWFGYSVGRWDGDNTLVIDSTGSDDRSWLDSGGHPHSVNMHIEERYTRVDHNHLEMTVTVEDPALYTKPWVLGRSTFIWIPEQETEEQICVPSEGIEYLNSLSRPSFGGAEAK